MSRPPDSMRPAELHPCVLHTGTRHRYRQLSRILLHLRNDLHGQQPQLALPTNSMLEHLVSNCPAYLLDNEDWQQCIIGVMEYLLAQLSPSVDDTADTAGLTFLRYDNLQPLFPNEELFDPQDACRFAQALLNQQRDFI